jgi:ubiquinone/menaquinone biosynthesis C-methylase UbiE
VPAGHVGGIAPLLRYLLGLEGLALLRGWLDPGRESAERRVEEIAALLADREELERQPAPVELSLGEGYAAWAPTYDSQPNPLTAVEEPIVGELLASVAPGRALDAACGTGRHLGMLTSLGHRVIGVDGSPEMLALARERNLDVDLREGDLGALPLPDASVDVALCALALNHSSDLGPPIAELARVLRPGGRLVTTDIHPMLSALGGDALFTRPDGTRAFVREATHPHGEWFDAFDAAGLRVRRCLEPAWEPWTVTMIGKAARRIPEALAEALVGLPCVLVWELERV